MESIGRLTHIDGLHDVVMTELGGGLALFIKPVHEVPVIAHLFRKDFHGNDAVQRYLPGAIHMRHGSFADFPDHLITGNAAGFAVGHHLPDALGLINRYEIIFDE